MLLGNALMALRPVLHCTVLHCIYGAGKVARDEVFGGVTTVAGFAVGLVLLLAFAAGEIYVRGMPRFEIARWLDLLYLGVGTTAATFLLWNYTHRHVEAGAAGLYFNLIPTGLAFAAMFGESAGSWPGTAPRPCGPEVGTKPFDGSVRGAILRGLRGALALNPRACCKEG